MFTLAILTIARLGLHAIFLPAFEGPDEPHHLARIVSFARDPLPAAWKGAPIDGSITRALELRPCSPGRGDCPPFGTDPGAFNLLHPNPSQPDERHRINPENHQPPLFYLVAGALLRVSLQVLPSDWLDSPDERLLWARLFSFFLVVVALVFPLRGLFRNSSLELQAVGLFFLLLPGASEALVRCSNDAAVFCWAAFLLHALERRASPARVCLLLAIGPLVKLTAFPIAAVAIVALWQRRHRRGAVLGAIASSLVFPVQALRGWHWGGTYEFNRTLPWIPEPAQSIAAGFARSVYTIVKTVPWLGGWSSIRAPWILVILWFLLLAGLLLSWRPPPGLAVRLPDIAGVAVAILGCMVFIVGNRRFYGVWGGVGGWYIWDWAPWIFLLFARGRVDSPRARRVFLLSAGAFAAAANVLYFEIAARFYH